MKKRPVTLQAISPRGSNRAAALFPWLAAVWILPRLFLGPADPSDFARSAVASVTAAPSPRSGRYEVRVASSDGGDDTLFRAASAREARARLESAVQSENDTLALLALRIGGQIELYPEEGVTGLRLSGVVVPFYDNDADRLARARQNAAERPHESLATVAGILEERLSEPREGFALEEDSRRRDLTRTARDIRDALDLAELRAGTALERFREETLTAVRESAGSFRRRGPGRIVEILLAALLAATLRAAVRSGRPSPPLRLTLSAAAVAALAGVLLLEGTDLLPIDPVTGTSLAFVPLAALLGIAGAVAVGAASGAPEHGPAAAAPRPAEEGEETAEAKRESRPEAAEEAPRVPPPPPVEPAEEPAAVTPRTERELADEQGAAPFFFRARTPSPQDGRLPFLRRRGRR